MTAAEIERAFDAADPLAVGVEEELMLLDLETGDLAPRAAEVLELLGGDPSYKLELPASQLEIVSGPCESVAELGARMASGRAELAAAADGVVGLGAAGTHPFAAVEGELNQGERYRPTAEGFGRYARRQLVCALQVHVAIGWAERTLAVYADCAPGSPSSPRWRRTRRFTPAGTRVGFGAPEDQRAAPAPGRAAAARSWEAYAEALAWGGDRGDAGDYSWWWELRPHPRFGTLEVRVRDAQTTPAEAAAVAAFAHALVAWLAERDDRRPVPTPSWRIAENRWVAASRRARGQVRGPEPRSTAPGTRPHCETPRRAPAYGRAVGCAAEFAGAGELMIADGATRQRAVAAERGLHGLIGWLRERFTAPRLD